MSEVPASLPWWRSRVIIGAVVSIVAKALVLSGVIAELSPEDESQLADVLVMLIGGIGDLIVIVSRVRQKHAPPITASKKG